MLEYGFIKLHRSILKWEWYNDRNTTALFIHLILTANIEDIEWRGLKIPRGSRASSYAKLSKELHLTIKEIRTALQHLEQTGEVARTPYPKFTVFTVKNYDFYQIKGTKNGKRNGTQMGNQGASKGQQSKKDKENIRNKEIGASAPGAQTPEHALDQKSIYERMRE